MSNRYGHHQKCVLAHISGDVKRSGPKGVGGLHFIHRPLRFLLGSAARIHRIVTTCCRSRLWGAIWAVVR